MITESEIMARSRKTVLGLSGYSVVKDPLAVSLLIETYGQQGLLTGRITRIILNEKDRIEELEFIADHSDDAPYPFVYRIRVVEFPIQNMSWL